MKEYELYKSWAESEPTEAQVKEISNAFHEGKITKAEYFDLVSDFSDLRIK